MPSLRKPRDAEALTLPARMASVAADCDVLVVGGGPAGYGAAIGAAQAGADVVLAERYGFLGGLATAGLVQPWASYHTSEFRPTEAGAVTMFPTDSGHGEPVIRGALTDLIGMLVEAGGALPPSAETGYVVPVDTEVLKMVALDALDKAGVRLLFHALATSVLGDGRVGGVVFETKSGPLAIRARCVVDCTGDADVAAAAEAPFGLGRAQDALPQPMTLMFRMGGFDREAFAGYVGANPGQWFGVYGLWDLVMEAHEAGEYHPPREDILLFGTPQPTEVTVNCTRVPKVVGTDAYDLSCAEVEARQQLAEIVRFLRARVPGFASAYVSQSGAIGVRETRRVLGEYVLTADDVLGARQFDDVVARNAYPMDIHNPEGRGTVIRKVPPGKAYDIPLRCLVPREVDGLMVAGRCVSATHEALSSVRVMPACVATGQAAGVCAALAASAGSTPREVFARDVQRELARQGAELRGAARAR